ncbi:MAG: ribonuclease Z [Clostridiales bacterium]|nr:ribonuclease Z [Clostridiales bacterium]
MIAIVAVDDRNGMMFNHRRLSQDRGMREKMLQVVAAGGASGAKLWMNTYSSKLFSGDDLPDTPVELVVDDGFAEKAGTDDFAFFEDAVPDAGRTQKLILFKWNRAYPADLYFDIDLSGWTLETSEEFDGSSHHMTMEAYRAPDATE